MKICIKGRGDNYLRAFENAEENKCQLTLSLSRLYIFFENLFHREGGILLYVLLNSLKCVYSNQGENITSSQRIKLPFPSLLFSTSSKFSLPSLKTLAQN